VKVGGEDLLIEDLLIMKERDILGIVEQEWARKIAA